MLPLMAAGWILFSLSEASAVDYLVTGPNTNTNGDGNPNPIAGNGDALSIEHGSSIDAINNDSGVSFDGGGNNTVTNDGTVTTQGLDVYGLVIQNSANSILISNGHVGTFGDGGIGLLMSNSPNGQVINNGTILTMNVNAHGMGAAQSDAVRLFNSGTIRTVGDTAYGMISYLSTNATIENSGLIETQDVTSFGIFNDESNNAIIRNSGVVKTNGEEAFGIFNRISTGAFVSNSGTITTGFDLASGIRNASSSDVVIVNTGLVETFGSNAHGIANETSDNVTITNAGSIRVDGVNSVGVKSDLAAIISNSGLIFAATAGESAIEMSSGDDTVTLAAGARLQGLIDVNGGTDSVTLDHNGQDIGWRFTIDTFDTASDDLLVNGIPFVEENPGSNGAGSTTVTVADMSREANAGAALADITGAVRGVTSSRITQAWAMAESGVDSHASMAGNDHAKYGWSVWAKALGAQRDRASAEFTVATRHNIGGVVVGADILPTQRSLLGVFGGFAQSRLEFDDKSQNNSGARPIDTNTAFGGLYGRIESVYGLFADGTATVGYADGDAGERLRANNLVTGGIETITGGDASGFFAASSLTLGAHIPAGDSTAKLIPSIMLGQATQWREGYSESGTGAQSIEDYLVTVLSARLQLAGQIQRVTSSGIVVMTTVRAGLDAEQDISENVDLRLLGSSFSVESASEALQFGGFLGANLTLAQNDTLAFSLEGELNFAGHNADEFGGQLTAGVRAQF